MLSVKFLKCRTSGNRDPIAVEVRGFEDIIDAFWFGLEWGLIDGPRIADVFVYSRHFGPAHTWLWSSGVSGAWELKELLTKRIGKPGEPERC